MCKKCQTTSKEQVKTYQNSTFIIICIHIQNCGPPFGWDSSSNKSHHKTEIKASAKNTQSNPSKLIQQTIVKLMEYQTAQLTMDVYKLQKKRVPQPKMNNNGVFGGKFHLYINHNTGVPTINCRLVADTEKVHYPDNLQSDG